jgi:thiamine biosynthesis lipoprotein
MLLARGYNQSKMSFKRHTRRSFLQGQAASRELSGLTSESGELESGSPAAPSKDAAKPAAMLPMATDIKDRDSLLVSVRRRAMACDFEVQLAATREDGSMEHVFAALDLVEALEAQMTIYRDDSEVIRVNREAAERPVKVESRLFELMREAEKLYHETAGAYDITSGPLSEAWGFSRREGRVPSDAEIAEARQRVGMHHVALDAQQQTIAFRRGGVWINLNSNGKGYALDRMAELLALNSVDDYLLHGGKSSVMACGDQPGRFGDGWTIGLRHPLRPAERLAEFCLRDQALSTSGSGTQFFIRRGRRYGHILDPRTGRPAEGLYSATVIAPTAAAADALSTAFYVMGPDEVAKYCAARPKVAALLVAPAEREGDVQLHAFGLDDDEWRPSSDG